MLEIKNKFTKIKQQNQNNNKKSKKAILFVFLCVAFSIGVSMNLAAAQDYYVSSSGGNSIQVVLDKAMPGDVIHLKPGIYYQDFDTKRHGTSSAPITITGPPDAVIKGAGRGRIAQIFHDHYHLKGFTFDGLAGNDANSAASYRDKLLYVQGTASKEGVNGLKILNMTFKNSGGEAVRLRYFAHDNEIAYSRFENTGVFDFKFNGGGKNGESIYIGTSSNQWADGKNPTADPDGSNKNWIHHNNFNTLGNEAVDIKEGAMYNIVEYNTVTGQKDTESGGLDSRGDKNIFRYNTVFGNAGAGIRLGGHNINGHQYGVDNEAYGNKIHNNQNGGIKFQAVPQKNICGNEMSSNQGGNSVGTYGSQFDPTVACNFAVSSVERISTVNQDLLSSDLVNGILVTASSHDGNVPENTLDQSMGTRWSAVGDGEWIMYNLGKTEVIDFLEIAFYKGDSRVQYFEVHLSKDNLNWQKVYSGQSSGKTLDFQKFDFPNAEAQYVKVVGRKNSVNSWNSLTEVKINYAGTSGTNTSPSTTNTSLSGINSTTISPDPTPEVITVTASKHDGNVPENTLDGDLNTRWSALGDGEWILYDLGGIRIVDQVKVAFHKGDSRIQYFEIQVSKDLLEWQTVYSGQSNGATLDEQTFDFPNTEARYVKVIGHKNTANDWNSLTEVKVV